jgi:predicted amidophosphoribosyltransferase
VSDTPTSLIGAVGDEAETEETKVSGPRWADPFGVSGESSKSVPIVTTIRQWSPTLPPDTAVTVPPQGASFPGHYYAADLAQAVAGTLAVPFIESLQRTDTKAYHHPRESMRQAPYRSIRTPPPVVIVVDDLITSGTTMRLALEALRNAGVTAFGFAFAGC